MLSIMRGVSKAHKRLVQKRRWTRIYAFTAARVAVLVDRHHNLVVSIRSRSTRRRRIVRSGSCSSKSSRQWYKHRSSSSANHSSSERTNSACSVLTTTSVALLLFFQSCDQWLSCSPMKRCLVADLLGQLHALLVHGVSRR